MLGVAKCGHCQNTATKMIAIEPSGASYKQMAVCCSACSAILGITGYYDTGTLQKQTEAKVNALAQKVASIEHQLSHIAQAIQNLRR